MSLISRKESNSSSIEQLNKTELTFANSQNPNLSKIIKTEEDLIFKSERSIQNDEKIYDIENKIIEKQIKESSKGNSFRRTNIISNRETIIHKKIINKEYQNLNIKKDIENNNSELNNDEIINENIKKNCGLKNFIGNENVPIKIFLIIFLLFVLGAFLYFFIFIVGRNMKN